MSEIIVTIDQMRARLRAFDLPWVTCALGPNGIAHHKTEGDGTSPAGTFALKKVLYRKDRTRTPQTALPVCALKPSDGWCDAAGDIRYNRPVSLPYKASAETMFRTDHLYDICVTLGHNDTPPKAGHGSAIFFHLAHDDYRPTQGCIALSEKDMRLVLTRCTTNTVMTLYNL